MESSTSWVASRLADLHAQNDDKTVAIVVSKEEIKQAGASVQFLGHLINSKEFRLDLNLTNTYWFYHQETLRRCLLLQYTGKNSRQELRQLGAKAAQELQSKKSNNVEVLISDSIDKELLGIFANSFYLTNYEFTFKTDP